VTRLWPQVATLIRAFCAPDRSAASPATGLWPAVAALVAPALWAPHPAGSTGLVALATAAVVGALTVLLLAGGRHGRLRAAASPARIRALALRTRAHRAAFLRLRDPDAPGRARPRAPSAAVAVA